MLGSAGVLSAAGGIRRRHSWNLLRRLDDRQLYPQDAILVSSACALGANVHAEGDLAGERPMLDLDLLVNAPLGVPRPALAPDDQLPPPNPEVHVLHPGA